MSDKPAFPSPEELGELADLIGKAVAAALDAWCLRHDLPREHPGAGIAAVSIAPRPDSGDDSTIVTAILARGMTPGEANAHIYATLATTLTGDVFANVPGAIQAAGAVPIPPPGPAGGKLN